MAEWDQRDRSRSADARSNNGVQPQRKLVGNDRTPLLIVDGIGPPPQDIVALADALAPFPPAGLNYPGLRRMIMPADESAFAYVWALLDQAKPYLGGAFDLDGFDLTEASFSLVTTPPNALTPEQRAPHFDSVDPAIIAILHYITPCAGTAFYRHRPTAIECVSDTVVDEFVALARPAAERAPADYIHATTADYELIEHVDGVPGRLVAYPGNLLHSGIIPPGMSFSADPRKGRLTANLFIQGR